MPIPGWLCCMNRFLQVSSAGDFGQAETLSRLSPSPIAISCMLHDK